MRSRSQSPSHARLRLLWGTRIWIWSLQLLDLPGADAGRKADLGSLIDVDLSSLSRRPLWEPTVQEYFPAQRGGARDENGLASAVVLRNPSWEEFAYHARKGYPIMVADWGEGMQYNGWSGKKFAETFPFGYMKAEYISDMPGFKQKDHDIKIIDDEYRFNLGTFKPDKKTIWHNYSRPASRRYQDDPLKPTTGPYVWHVKDELTPEQQKLVQARFEAPAFLQDPINRAKMNASFEIWFSPGSGAGAGAHNDGYCESVVSLQLLGNKKWRKMLQPEMTFLHSYDEFDGGVYRAGYWKPDLGFTNSPGSAVIWPPGYLHETKTEAPASGECGSAITLQFAFPQPVQFLRAFLPRLALSSEVGACAGRQRSWSIYATFSVPGIKPSPKEIDMKGQLQEILRSVDGDGDGIITVDETRQFMKSSRSSVKSEAQQYSSDVKELFFQLKAEDTVAYHDMDGDMAVSRQELWDSLVQWNVVRVRMKTGLELVNVADRQGLEAMERSLDRLRRRPIELPEKLRPELEDIFSLPKGSRIFKSLKGVHSFSDSEFFSRAMDRIDELRNRGGRADL